MLEGTVRTPPNIYVIDLTTGFCSFFLFVQRRSTALSKGVGPKMLD